VRITRTSVLPVRRWVAARWRDDRGASAVELAIIAPVLLFLSFLIIAWAMWFDAKHAALAAAQAGDLVARQEALEKSTWQGDAEGAAEKFYAGLNTGVLAGMSASKPPPQINGDTVTVTVTGQLRFVFDMGISVSVTGPIECFRPFDDEGQACSG
jgi:Flp pilus assembly protein TadG